MRFNRCRNSAGRQIGAWQLLFASNLLISRTALGTPLIRSWNDHCATYQYAVITKIGGSPNSPKMQPPQVFKIRHRRSKIKNDVPMMLRRR
jgi:hypothetical protein